MSHTKAVTQRLMASGPAIEQSLMRRDIFAQTRKLEEQNPVADYSTVRRLLTEARAEKIDKEAFKEWIRRKNAFALVAELSDWEKYRARQG